MPLNTKLGLCERASGGKTEREKERERVYPQIYETESGPSEFMSITETQRCALSDRVYLHDGKSHTDPIAQGYRITVRSSGIYTAV